MAAKQDFARRAVDMASTMANMADNLETLEKVYTAREYTYTDQDLVDLGITAADLNAIFGVILRFGQWINGQAVTTTDNRILVNKYRTDI